MTSVNKPSEIFTQIILSWGSRSPARKRCHQQIHSDLVLDFCGVPGGGCVPTFCFSSASNAGNMLLLYGILKTSHSHRHPATTLARFPKGQLITQEKLKNQNRANETPADSHHSHPLLPQLPRDFRKPCHIAPFLPTRCLLKQGPGCLFP